MGHHKLTINEINTEKRFIRLSDGHKYLFGDDAAHAISAWRPGMVVWVGVADYPPNSFELRPVDDMGSTAVVVWVP